jgi:hypothetical protein
LLVPQKSVFVSGSKAPVFHVDAPPVFHESPFHVPKFGSPG